MKNNNPTTLLTILGLLIIGLALQGTARAQPPGSAGERSVVVTNTTANPVPVTGGVAVTNTPTVRLDQAANVVRVGRARTVQLHHSQFGGGPGAAATHTVDTEEYDTIRVCVSYYTGAAMTVSIESSSIGESGTPTWHDLEWFTAPANPNTGTVSICKTYEVPGSTVRIRLNNVQGTVWTAVWGR